MKKHFKYLGYVLRHKLYVFIEGRKLGLPIWQLLVHDWQKFLWCEWWPYVWSFYGPWKRDERPQWLIDAFDRAWLHHLHCGGQHHYEHWIIPGQQKPLEIPDHYRREMLADLRGTGWAKVGYDNTKEWYLERREHFKKMLHPNTRRWIEEQIGVEDGNNASK